MSIPDKLYRVTRKGGKRAAGHNWRSSQSKGNNGGTLTTLEGARQRASAVADMWDGAEVKIFEGTITWTEIS